MTPYEMKYALDMMELANTLFSGSMLQHAETKEQADTIWKLLDGERNEEKSIKRLFEPQGSDFGVNEPCRIPPTIYMPVTESISGSTPL